MSGFSPQWLDLREPADHRARNAKLAHQLAQHFDGWRPVTVIDLGCGTGSNLRATAPLLGAEQQWTLVDYEQSLLDAAVGRLSAWADAAAEREGGLELFKGAKRISVTFRRADLARNLDDALGEGANLITASALFDLASKAFIETFVRAAVARRAAFYTVLTYDGDQRWTPQHEADAAMLAAFHAHQSNDKGFGPAAGPDAPDLLGEAFQAAGYTVLEGDSAWRLGAGEYALIAELAAGFAQAARETGMVDAAAIDSWAGVVRTGAVVGHTDTLALPG
jgi:hypothetical protein